MDKTWGPDYLTFGLQVSDDFEGRASYQLGAEYTRTGLNRWGGEWRTRTEIGRITGLHSEFFQPAGPQGQFFALPYVDYRALNQEIRVDDAVVSSYRLRRSTGGVDIGWEPNTLSRMYLGVAFTRGTASSLIGSVDGVDDFRESSGSLRLGWVRDTLDDADFPRRGGRLDLLWTEVLEPLGAPAAGRIYDLSWDHALSRGAHSLLLGTRLRMVDGDPGRFDAVAPLGGFTYLSGFNERALLGEHLALVRAVYYRELTDPGALLSVPVYLGGSLEAGNVYDERSDWQALEGLIHAGSVFIGVDSPFGPILLGYGRNDQGESAFSLNFGSLLRPRN